jgi:hypothetical protein
MATLLLTVAVLGTAFTLLASRILLVKDGEFRGTCATNNPMLKDQIGSCPVCGKVDDEPCRYDDLKTGVPETLRADV